MEQDILEPFTHRRLTLSNRTVMRCTCQSPAMDTLPRLWHGAARGPRTLGDETSLVMVESTAVTRPTGITPHLYGDTQAPSPGPCWRGRGYLRDSAGNRNIEAPSRGKHGLEAETAKKLPITEIGEVVEAFRRETARARRSCLDVIVLYGEPSYLISQFCRDVHKVWDMRLAFRQEEGDLV